MRYAKRLFGGRVFRALLSRLVVLYIHLVYVTTSWRDVGDEHPRRLVTSGTPCIAAFWHGRLLMLPSGLQRMLGTIGRRDSMPVHMLISDHGDGLLISAVIRHFRISTIAGSTNRGGSAGLRAMVRCLHAGEHVSITPDGPNGPAMHATAGTVVAASLSGAPILPYTYATSRRRVLNTWDRFHFPLPLGRGVILWGEPIAVPPDLDRAAIEHWRCYVEERMIALTAEADRLVGHQAVVPGTLPRRAFQARRRAARHAARGRP
jgi:lysophospholipid acyltransferase (LPLAT)-like uncharacterized protein